MNKKFARVIQLFSVFAMLTLITACGGGGGGSSSGGGGNGTGDTLTLGIVSGTTTTTTYTEKTSSTAPAGSDPQITGYFWSGYTWVELYNNYDSTLGWESHFLFTMPTTTPGTYAVQGSSFSYSKRGTSGSYAFDGKTGTVTYTRIDTNPGGRIQGTFNNVSLWNSSTSTGITVSGNFNVTVE